MAKQPLLSLPSSFQICKEVQNPYCGREPGLLSFLDECPKYSFSAAYTKQMLFGG